MSRVESDKTCITEEVPNYGLDDLFISRTDERGTIRAGNNAFVRISGYDWSQLRKAPHKIIRHPDTPRGVFSLFWDRLREGKPVGAYVKNRAADGRYYWVFAIAMPVEGGFISVWMKPCSAMHDRIMALYRVLLSYERDRALKPEDSRDTLLQHLGEQGFASYDAFMAEAIRAEVAARAEALGKPMPPLLEDVGHLQDTVTRMEKDLAAVRASVYEIRSTPFNLRIQASRVGDIGIPMQVISQNYGLLAKDIEEVNAQMQEAVTAAAREVEVDGFAVAAAGLMGEAARQFRAQSDWPDGVEAEAEIAAFEREITRFAARGDGLKRQMEALLATLRQLRRVVSGLAVVRVMCRIEAAGIADDSGGIGEVTSRLLKFQRDMVAQIDRMDAECVDAIGSAGRLQGQTATGGGRAGRPGTAQSLALLREMCAQAKAG
ncbi:PAS domain-containing protein [Mesobacterium pallidum]|uniref:PAS domain-containing protein n=1 Tax=Mesobacterium pallidum TaxID=2872037 RepID=UPI001EE25452|nr:PAS domain-containing protein [Mesobacterium pallidum]